MAQALEFFDTSQESHMSRPFLLRAYRTGKARPDREVLRERGRREKKWKREAERESKERKAEKGRQGGHPTPQIPGLGPGRGGGGEEGEG